MPIASQVYVLCYDIGSSALTMLGAFMPQSWIKVAHQNLCCRKLLQQHTVAQLPLLISPWLFTTSGISFSSSRFTMWNRSNQGQTVARTELGYKLHPAPCEEQQRLEDKLTGLSASTGDYHSCHFSGCPGDRANEPELLRSCWLQGKQFQSYLRWNLQS